jgi:hypothetical protein
MAQNSSCLVATRISSCGKGATALADATRIALGARSISIGGADYTRGDESHERSVA